MKNFKSAESFCLSILFTQMISPFFDMFTGTMFTKNDLAYWAGWRLWMQAGSVPSDEKFSCKWNLSFFMALPSNRLSFYLGNPLYIINSLFSSVPEQDRWNGFESGGAMEHLQVLLATMVSQPGKFLNSRRSRLAKTVPFWPWWQHFNSFCFESFSFSPLFPPVLSPPPSSIAGPAECNFVWNVEARILKF